MIDWQPMATVPADREVLICFYDEARILKYRMDYCHSWRLSQLGKKMALGWADINLPEVPTQGEEK